MKVNERVTHVGLSTSARMSGPIRSLLGITKACLKRFIKQTIILFMVPRVMVSINESSSTNKNLS